MKTPAQSTVWSVWTVFVLIYSVMNFTAVSKVEAPVDPKILFGWGIIMPILTNLVWWVIAFRFRTYFRQWWIFGIFTALFVGVAGFLTMLRIAGIS